MQLTSLVSAEGVALRRRAPGGARRDGARIPDESTRFVRLQRREWRFRHRARTRSRVATGHESQTRSQLAALVWQRRRRRTQSLTIAKVTLCGSLKLIALAVMIRGRGGIQTQRAPCRFDGWLLGLRSQLIGQCGEVVNDFEHTLVGADQSRSASGADPPAKRSLLLGRGTCEELVQALLSSGQLVDLLLDLEAKRPERRRQAVHGMHHAILPTNECRPASRLGDRTVGYRIGV